MLKLADLTHNPNLNLFEEQRGQFYCPTAK